MSIDDCCDGTCSGSYPTPGIKLVSHEEVERMVDEALKPDYVSHEEVERKLDEVLKPDYVLKYNLFLYSVKDRFPRIYKALKKLGLHHPY